MEQTQSLTMGATINNESTTTEPLPQNVHAWGFNAFYWYQIFALDSAIVKTQSD